MRNAIRHTVYELMHISRISGLGLDEVAQRVGTNGVLEIMRAHDTPHPEAVTMKVRSDAGINNGTYRDDRIGIEYALADECARAVESKMRREGWDATLADAIRDALISGEHRSAFEFSKYAAGPVREKFTLTDEVAKSKFYRELLVFYSSKEFERHMYEHIGDIPRADPYRDEWVDELRFDAYLNAEFRAPENVEMKCLAIQRMVDIGLSDDEIVERLSGFDCEAVREFLGILRNE